MSRTLGTLNRLPEIQQDLQTIWNAQFAETLTANKVKNESAIRDTLATLEKAVFGATREQMNDAYARTQALKKAVIDGVLAV